MRARPVLLEVSVCKPTAKSQFCETRKFLRRWKLKCSISFGEILHESRLPSAIVA
ncbi:PREDICTED: uncharacterized protein LOC108375709 isoform X2 [Rhagoletis zephyria]|uniref:uncharacterized protein LOC108375709 isoform X2 n=1 Tax=Rhagoletis zephyria TaxID=28612 RepID=UPI000811693D|nr:PREDICTED: uncharacterized protein LOC108375709 isoform X2 [Rhagoletis zephyria]